MIDYKRLMGWSSVVSNKKGLRLRFDKGTIVVSDVRQRSLWRAIMHKTTPYIKFYVTPYTVKRIHAMELSDLHGNMFEYLRDKYLDETGFIYMEDGVHCLYHVGSDCIAIWVMKGTLKNALSGYVHKNDNSLRMFMNCDYGCAVIPFQSENIDISINSTIDRMMAICKGHKFMIDPIEQKRIMGMAHCLGDCENKQDIILERLSESKEYKPLADDYTIRREAVERCVKAFVFIKTAKTINETFIPTGSTTERQFMPTDYNGKGVIKVDTFWDKEIDVIAPFQVRGHFRNQPKKNDKGEWIKEVIYIDAFMKSGYHRKATKDAIET